MLQLYLIVLTHFTHKLLYAISDVATGPLEWCLLTNILNFVFSLVLLRIRVPLTFVTFF